MHLQANEERDYAAVGRKWCSPSTGPVPDIKCFAVQVFREPMITTAGLSYEQSALQEHFAKVGNFDPVTRKPTTPEQAIPNLGLRGATEHYLQEHPWAWADVC